MIVSVDGLVWSTLKPLPQVHRRDAPQLLQCRPGTHWNCCGRSAGGRKLGHGRWVLKLYYGRSTNSQMASSEFANRLGARATLGMMASINAT